MGKNAYRSFALLFIALNIILFPVLIYAEFDSKYLSVITSANPESNAVKSFVIIKEGDILKEGIKHATENKIIGQQTPFVIEYNKTLKKNLSVQWHIKVTNKKYGTITLLSNFKGKGRLFNSGYYWESEVLDKSVKDRHRLVFRPKPFNHQPRVYKKGRGPKGKRSKYGGGTRRINEKKYNPKFAYDITLKIIRDKRAIFTHNTHLEMDHKDMIRQEYINHYNRRRYKENDRGNIPVPRRNEISDIPPKPEGLKGNPLTESRYRLIINDGMLELASSINKYYARRVKKINKKGGLLDLNKKRRKVPDNKLWLSSGWRNPERNEWYSNYVNGNHQRGGAVDIVIMAPANSVESSIGYWVLWDALTKNRKRIKGSWQLEKSGVSMTTREYYQDIEPKNGIPDAFDKADHLHANVSY